MANLYEEQERVLTCLTNEEPGSSKYDDVLKNYRDLADISRNNERLVTEKKRDKMTFIAKVLSALAAVGTFLLMLKQEITGSFRSKGFTWFTDFLKKSDK